MRPIAVGGMLVGAAYTLFKMRKSLTAGLGKAFADLRQTAEQQSQALAHRTLHEFEDGLRPDCRDVRAHVLSLHSYFRIWCGRPILAAVVMLIRRIFLRHGLGKPGWIHWLFE